MSIAAAVIVGDRGAGPRARLELLDLSPLKRRGGWSRQPAIGSRRRGLAIAACLPDLSLTLAAELRAGRDPATALATAAGQDTPLREQLTELMHGSSSGPSLSRDSSTIDPGLARLIAVWSVGSESGAAVADVLDRLAEAFDEELADAAAIRSVLAGPRSTAWLLAGLPVFGLLLAQVIGAHPMRLLIGTPLGTILLVSAAGLDGLGLLWTNRIVSKAEAGR